MSKKETDKNNSPLPWLTKIIKKKSLRLHVVFELSGMVGQHFVPRLGLAPLKDFSGLWPHLVRLKIWGMSMKNYMPGEK